MCVFVCLYVYLCVLVTQSCLTLWNPMDCNLPGSSVYGIILAKILEWVAIPFSKGSSRPRDWTWVSCIAGGFLTIWATREAHILWNTALQIGTTYEQNNPRHNPAQALIFSKSYYIHILSMSVQPPGSQIQSFDWWGLQATLFLK